jgi:hypothetical protein
VKDNGESSMDGEKDEQRSGSTSTQYPASCRMGVWQGGVRTPVVFKGWGCMGRGFVGEKLCLHYNYESVQYLLCSLIVRGKNVFTYLSVWQCIFLILPLLSHLDM